MIENPHINRFIYLSLLFFVCLLISPLTIQAQARWWNVGWAYRIPLKVDVLATERENKPVEVQLDFTALLADVGEVKAFNASSIRLIEVDANDRILDEKVPFQFDRDENYNSVSNAKGVLTFLLKGKTLATRKYYLYFDSNSSIRPALVTSELALTEDYLYEGQYSYKITSERATFIYHKFGAAFASILDRYGNDWVGYQKGGQSHESLRGVPNMGDFAQPGLTNAKSKVILRGPLKVSFLSETLDGETAFQWDVFPDYARMTILRTNKPYWFSYEGTPAGRLDTANAYMVNSEGKKFSVRQDWQQKLPTPEWIYFGDQRSNQAFYLAHHEADDKLDQFWQRDGEMTVFGFGRKYRSSEKLLVRIPNTFTIGFADNPNFLSASRQINGAFKPVKVLVGETEGREMPFALLKNNGPALNAPISESIAEAPAYRNKPEHKFFGGYCTWYASKKFKEFTGYPVTWSGDGGAWFDNAAAEGRTVTTNPREAIRGSVMVWTRGSHGKGHVAFVEEVDENGIYISEMNVKGRWIVSEAFIPFTNLDKGTKYKFRGFILPE